MILIGAIPPALIAADLNHDNCVDGADLSVLLSQWGPGDKPADLNGNGRVDGADLAQLLTQFGTAWIVDESATRAWVTEKGETWRWIKPEQCQFQPVGEEGRWSALEVKDADGVIRRVYRRD